jgi:hypothetical protein
VRIETESAADGGMARGAVAFRMTGRARLETLARGLSVTEAETAKGIVISADPELCDGRQSRALVATLAELRWIVTV